MDLDEFRPMTKSEIAAFLNVSSENILIWAQGQWFGDWLDDCTEHVEKVHEENDILMFGIINYLNSLIDEGIPFDQRIQRIQQNLYITPEAERIREQLSKKRSRPEVERWRAVSTHGACLKYEYEWLEPLQPEVEKIADFGCWASDARSGTCAEPYALLWVLDALEVTVVDKEQQYIQNAQEWLRNIRQRYDYFNDYGMEFFVGDMTDRGLIAQIDALNEGDFDLSYCHNVLYNLYPDPSDLQDAIGNMARVVKAGGWIIAVEPKAGVEYEQRMCDSFISGLSIPAPPIPLNQPTNISEHFEAVGLTDFVLDNAPEWSYCYQKPSD